MGTMAIQFNGHLLVFSSYLKSVLLKLNKKKNENCHVALCPKKV